MKAIAQSRYGSPDVLEIRDVDMPEIARDEVLVRVRAAGLDRGVWHLMTGLPYFLRVILPDLGLRAPKNPVRGSDLAGVVAAVGQDVTRFAVGDEVFGVGKGSYAEYAPAAESKLAPKPASLTFEEAAVVPISGLTALQAVRDGAKVRPGQKVLVIGASGGVGTFAVQVAKSYGAEVTGVCSSTKVDFVRSLGADHVVDYAATDFAEAEHEYDAILDTGGHSSLSRLRRALARDGTLVIVGAETNGKWLGGFDRSIRAMVLSPFIRQRLIAFVNKERHEDLMALTGLIEGGKVRPVVERAFRLDETAKAIDHLVDGHARGKLAIIVDDTSEVRTG